LWGIRHADHVTPLYLQELALNFADKLRSLSVWFTCRLRATEFFLNVNVFYLNRKHTVCCFKNILKYYNQGEYQCNFTVKSDILEIMSSSQIVLKKFYSVTMQVNTREDFTAVIAMALMVTIGSYLQKQMQSLSSMCLVLYTGD
jgi:hypothetical protein